MARVIITETGLEFLQNVKSEQQDRPPTPSHLYAIGANTSELSLLSSTKLLPKQKAASLTDLLMGQFFPKTTKNAIPSQIKTKVAKLSNTIIRDISPKRTEKAKNQQNQTKDETTITRKNQRNSNIVNSSRSYQPAKAKNVNVKILDEMDQSILTENIKNHTEKNTKIMNSENQITRLLEKQTKYKEKSARMQKAFERKFEIQRKKRVKELEFDAPMVIRKLDEKQEVNEVFEQENREMERKKQKMVSIHKDKYIHYWQNSKFRLTKPKS